MGAAPSPGSTDRRCWSRRSGRRLSTVSEECVLRPGRGADHRLRTSARGGDSPSTPSCRPRGGSCWALTGRDDVRVRRHGLRPAAANRRHRDRWSDCSSTRCRCGSRLRPEETLGALLDRVQAEQAALLDHHYLGPGRDPARRGAGGRIRHAHRVRVVPRRPRRAVRARPTSPECASPEWSARRRPLSAEPRGIRRRSSAPEVRVPPGRLRRGQPSTTSPDACCGCSTRALVRTSRWPRCRC